MKKIVTFLLLGSISQFGIAQNWAKYSSFPQKFQFLTLQHFSKGDTVIVVGRDFNNASKHPFHISEDGGKTWNLEQTSLSISGSANYTSIQVLPQNNLILGFSSTPSLGTYSFQSVGNWSLFVRSALGSYAEFAKNSLLYAESSSGKLYKLKADGTELVNTNKVFLFKTYYNHGSRLFLGSNTGAVKYIDNEDVANMKDATFTPALTAGDGSTRFFKDAQGNLLATFHNGSVKIYKSVDNGVSWNQVLPTGLETSIGCSTTDIMMDDANTLYITSSSCSRKLYKSTDNGLSFSSFNSGLPTGSNSYYFIKSKSKVLVTTLTLNASLPWDENNTGYYALDVTTNIKDDFAHTASSMYVSQTTDKTLLVVNSISEPMKLVLFDKMGQRVLEKEITQEKTELPALKPDMYIVTLSGISQRFTKKVVLQ